MDDLERMPSSACPKVFIGRDYSDGLAVKFQNKFPPELEGRIDSDIFRETINQINEFYCEAERLSGHTYCLGCLACLTAYLSYLCMDTYYEKCMKRAASYIADQNRTIYGPHGLMIVDPAERGLRVIEIAILQEASAVRESTLR